MEPVFRLTDKGIPSLRDTNAAFQVRQEQRQKDRSEAKSVAVINAQAKAAVTARGGDPSNIRHVLGQYIIQFGQYRGMTFKWLLENAPGWVGFLVASLETDKEPANTGNRWLNKMALKKYVLMYREGREIVIMKKREAERKKVTSAAGQSFSTDEDAELIAAVEEYESGFLGRFVSLQR